MLFSLGGSNFNVMSPWIVHLFSGWIVVIILSGTCLKGIYGISSLGEPDADRCLEWCLGVVRGRQKQQHRLLQSTDTGYKSGAVKCQERRSCCIFLYVHQLTSAGHDATWQSRRRGSQQRCRTALWTWTLLESMTWHLQLVKRTQIRVLL